MSQILAQQRLMTSVFGHLGESVSRVATKRLNNYVTMTG